MIREVFYTSIYIEMEVYNTVMSGFDSLLKNKGLTRPLTQRQWETICDQDRATAKMLKNILMAADRSAYNAWYRDLDESEKSKYVGKWVYSSNGSIEGPFDTENEALGEGLSTHGHVVPYVYVKKVPLV